MIELPWVDQELVSEITQIKLSPEKVALVEKFHETYDSLYESESKKRGRPLTMEEETPIYEKAKKMFPGAFEVLCEWEALNSITQFEIDGFNINNGNQDRLL